MLTRLLMASSLVVCGCGTDALRDRGDAVEDPVEEDGTCGPGTPDSEPVWRAASGWRGRLHHTATRLLDGNVLAVGGMTFLDGSTTSVDLFDVNEARWVPKASLATPRKLHSATLLSDGTVLVVGGYADRDPHGVTGSAERYNPALDTWESAGTLRVPRASHSATLMPDGRVLVVGGFVYDPISGWPDAATDVTEIYDPNDGEWTAGPSLPAARAEHEAIALPSGNVLVVCGYNDDACGFMSLNDTVLLFDWLEGSWSVAPGVNHPRNWGFRLNLMPDGRVLMSGGFSAIDFEVDGAIAWAGTVGDTEMFDTDTWQYGQGFLEPRGLHSATLLSDRRLLVVGGSQYHNPGWSVVASTELYDFQSDTSIAIASPRATYRYHTATVLSGDQVIIAGGGEYGDYSDLLVWSCR